MLSYLTSIKNKRFLVNFDIELLKNKIKDFNLLEDEEVHLLIDDSMFKNRKEIIVLTNKRILWNTSSSDLTISSSSSKTYTTGPNEINLSDLENCSVFIDQYGSSHILTILNKSIVLNLKMNHIENQESMKILFVNYLSSYISSFSLENQKNKILYKKIAKTLKKKNKNFLSLFLNISSILLVTTVILQGLYSFNIKIEDNIENMLLTALVMKLISIFINRKKSFFSNLLIYFVFFNIFLRELDFDTMEKIASELTFIIYSILFYNINLDKIIKFLMIVITLFITFSVIIENYMY